MADSIFRIHPAIGMARVGTSQEYYIAPETMAGFPDPNGGPTNGGLPIVAGTESQTITSSQIRDAQGAFKRQAARFRIYQYPAGAESYPTGQGEEVTIGSTVDGKIVEDIVWTVHLANKKANCYELSDAEGVDAYDNCATPPLRNVLPQFDFGNDPAAQNRLTALVIDPGPRAVKGANASPVGFDRNTTASYGSGGDAITEIPDYPQSFPGMNFPDISCPDQPISTLGEIATDASGRLLVLPAYGNACAFTADFPLDDDVNNDGWFDDVADGPVSATLVFRDGSTAQAQGAWVVTTDPGYAPQTLNVVSLWEDIYNTWVQQFNLVPGLYSNGQYNPDYQPSFNDDIFPIFLAASLQEWNTNLPDNAKAGHQSVGGITAQTDPTKAFNVPSMIRNPNNQSQTETGAPLMPLSLGDAGKSFLTLSDTQYFVLSQWFAKQFTAGPGPALGPGEFLDKATLVNCLGGRFSPGIDMTFIVRQPDLWIADWQQAGTFRINAQPLDYSQVKPGVPFLTAGWFPLRTTACPPFCEGVEPGDTSKFMAIPWHTDYNSCATHIPDPQPSGEITTYWSWPAQRPVAVYVAADVQNGQLGPQRFSVRGEGTGTDLTTEVGRYQERIDIVRNWSKIGVVVQGTAIDDGGTYPDNAYLEVQSRLDNSGNKVQPWPNTAVDPTIPES